MNLREVAKQFGKDVGLNIRAVRAYVHRRWMYRLSLFTYLIEALSGQGTFISLIINYIYSIVFPLYPLVIS